MHEKCHGCPAGSYDASVFNCQHDFPCVSKNILVSYKGGGYDGCTWEWNYFLFDAEGQFKDIGSSGSRAIVDMEQALAYFKDTSNVKGKDFFITDLEDKASIKEFVDDTNEGHVLAVTKGVNEHYGDDRMTFQCPYCEQESVEGQNTGYKGAGGIAIAMTGLICNDCYADHTCGYCGEFSEDIADLAMGKDKDRCTACVEE